MTKAIIFDLDGLLIDSEIISYKIYNTLLKEYGYTLSKEEYAQIYSGKTEEKNIINLIETYNLPWTLEEGLEKVLTLEKEYIQDVSLKNGARELLTYLKEHNYKTAIASSSTKERALTILNKHNLTSFFHHLIFGKEITNGKPAPDIFLKACEKLSQNPENCLVLEDSEAGIQAAYSAKIPVICIPDMKIPAQTYLNMTTAILSSLNDVISYLKSHSKEN